MEFQTPIHYSREGSPGWKVKDWETVNALLSYLNPNGMSYAIFEKPDGSYVQCAGAKRRLTVEARIYDGAERYRHFVFGIGELTGHQEKIQTTQYEIDVDSSQVLQMRHARLILKPWLEGIGFPESFRRTDVTGRFAEEPLVTPEE